MGLFDSLYESVSLDGDWLPVVPARAADSDQWLEARLTSLAPHS